ncbi:MAG: hypothetical protein M1828_006138 [Chrysothrix sp. TS-e1954]|nr:MAG: hypothetical protein M1828_006138 [Chrysothrix sp. TS-e1954]
MEPTRTLDKRSGTYVTAVNVLRARGESDPEPTYAPAVKKIRGAGLEVSVNPDLKVGKLVGGKIECPKPLYPEKVVCVKSVEVIETKTATAKSAKKVTKTLPAKTTTKTVLATTTSTKTVPNADASTTVTSTTSTVVTSTATTVTTTTQTATVTSTDVEASPTIYANCQPNNIISQFNGVNINGVSFPNGILSNTFPVNDAPSCCINCVNAPNCGGFAWAEGNCILFNDGNGGTTCDPTAVAFQFSTGFLGRQQPPSNVGNANCGQGAYTGQ